MILESLIDPSSVDSKQYTVESFVTCAIIWWSIVKQNFSNQDKLDSLTLDTKILWDHQISLWLNTFYKTK